MAISTKLTLDEFLALPETKPAGEYFDGTVVQKPMPTFAHGVIERLLGLLIGLYLRQHPIGDGGPEIRCIFGPMGRERALVPDFVFVRADRLRGMRGNEPFHGAPDLAVEILSPDDRMSAVLAKIRFYLTHGVRLVWLLDPDTRTITVYTSLGASRMLAEDETLDGGDVLPGFRARVAELLPAPDPSPA